ncbi:hypothetical protein DEO72_LG5g473 [Vigna unguiculata]|uniref:Transmembrane protein n=1 Tax=Vigna unguiculata TaxID=3917 RepID=A0A4D6LVF2_VIGUN|nr:hypothetical protein DEO72_LG5g473 [Vigna unguiculata]
MAQTGLFSRSLPFLVLLITFLCFSAQFAPTTTTADLKMRKLGNMPSPPPSPMPGRQRVPGGNQPAPPFMTRNP